MNKWITCAAVAALFLSSNIAHAVSCNPKAQVHQQRLANIQTAVSFGQIPSADDEQFVLCMLPEKEDQQAFKQRVQHIKNQQQARQQQEAEQRRQAIIAHNRPQSPQELAQAQSYCGGIVREGGAARDAGIAYCLAAWKANPHSKCGGGNLPCGSENEGLCYNPYANQRCVNGRVTNITTVIGVSAPSPWVESLPIQITKLSDGVYTDVGMPCANPGQRGVILIQGTTAKFGRNTYRLVNTKQAGVLDALNNGTGDNGYNGQIIVSGSTFRWDGYGVDAPRPFRLCQIVGAASPVQQSNVQPSADPRNSSPTGAGDPAVISKFDCVRSDDPRVTTTLVVDLTSSTVKSLNGFGGIGAGVGAQITDATISWRNRVIKNYGGGGFLDFAGSIDRATRDFTFTTADNTTHIFKCW